MREFQPLGLGGIFDAFLKVLFNRNAFFLSGIYAALSMPVVYMLFRGVMQGIIEVFSSLFGETLPGLADNPLYSGFDISPLVIVAAAVFYVFISLLYNLMSSDLFGARFFEKPYRLLPSFRAQVKKVPGHLLFLVFQGFYYLIVYIILSLIVGVISMLSLALGETNLMLIMVIVFMGVFIVLFVAADVFIFGVIPAYAIDRRGLFRSIQRSLVLSVKNYFRLCGASLLFRVILLVGTIIFNLALIQVTQAAVTLFGASGGQMQTVVGVTSLVYLALIILPTQIAGNAFQTVLYCNQKVRHEGLGAEILTRRFLDNIMREGRADLS
jgi:hypothetical protein